MESHAFQWFLDLLQSPPEGLVNAISAIAGWLAGEVCRSLYRMVRAPRKPGAQEQLYQFLMDHLSSPTDWVQKDNGIRHWLNGTDADSCGNIPRVTVIPGNPPHIQVGDEQVQEHLSRRQKKNVNTRVKVVLASIHAAEERDRLQALVSRLG